MIRIVFLFLFCFQQVWCGAQKISPIGTPFVQNYTKSQYKAGNQNWSIAQGKDGIIYAANNNGLITFDGAYWDLYPLDNRSFVRSVALAPNGDVYVGGKEEFGYLHKVNGRLEYRKLSQLVDSKTLENDEIWKILFLPDAVMFQSFSKFYLYRNNKIEVYHGHGESLLFAHQVKNKLWIEKIPSGLQSWSYAGFKSLSTPLSNILSILPFSDNEQLVGTAKQGLFLLRDNGEIVPWNANSTVNKLLKEAQLNNGIKIDDQTFAFGTIKNGIFIIDRHGKLLQHIHKRNGLQNNTVLSMTLDRQGNIWAGLDNGIDRIQINSPFYYYNDIFGEIGTVYAIKVFHDTIYLGTNQGLFFSEWTTNDSAKPLNFQFVPNSQGQVWSLDIFNNQLICGHNDGTFLIQGNTLTRISEWTGGWANRQLTETPSLFLQGNYTGLALFEYTDGWRLRHKFSELKAAVLNIFPKDARTFWVVLNNSLAMAEFSPNFSSLKISKSFSYTNDFPHIRYITPTSLRGNTLFATDKGIFIYDNVLSKFKPYDEFNKTLGSYARSKRIKTLDNNTYLFSNQGHFALVRFNQNALHVDSSTFNSLEDVVMKNYEIAEPVGNHLIFGLDNGIAIYDKKNAYEQQIAAPVIRGVQDISVSDSTIYLEQNRPLANKQNNIRILFAVPWFLSSPIKYQYMLEGQSTEWSKASETAFIDYTNLPAGSYTFKVRAITAAGTVSDSTHLKFSILHPWYLRWPALVVYTMLTGVGIFVTRRLIIEKIKRDKLALRQKLQKRQEEVLRKETEQNEKKLMAVKNEQLIQELELKNRELANAATNIVYKNELLNNLHEELLNLKDKNGNKLSNDQLQKVNKLVDNARSDERDWDLFEKSFNESHENFFKKLKADYPSLSPNDLKLCAYLRLNMSSKDIASLLNITTRGVEIRRYRLRKKFDLPTEKNLTEFLLER
ncbi:helix-turn-helix and ligand-binding sensor domain-containing protein [Sphingobacterium suaedae]|uniref:Triple tyrosine motif-containing protein n=1 Tax=Sphingobacterium suaedae TaxID=1686402 RepID=A0ABW5KEG1_9SPHI